ncbi:MAG: hypothetical protein JOZ73_08755 [Solirubrobacterales bacterium]|nr:hypothetical protein [Solirubrobacterales bacterium]
MSFLRTVSTRRLLALIAGVVAVIIGGTAIAVAAGSGGPVPPRKPLARAIHSALTAPQVAGVTARVTFTNNLIDSSDIQGADPILKGATGRVWVAKDRLRLELQSDNGDAQLVVNNGAFWAYDPSRKTVYEGKLPAGGAEKRAHPKHAKRDAVPSASNIQSQLNKAGGHLLISRAVPTDLAGQPAYSVRVSPKQNGGLIGGAQLAWDAVRGVPLSIGVYARGNSTPVLQLKATQISYKNVSSSVFSMSPPSGAKVVKVSTPSSANSQHAKRNKHSKPVTGVGAVAKRLSFRLSAPGALASRRRQDVASLGAKRADGALISYGNGLGGILVLEQSAKSAARAGSATNASQSSQSDSGDRQGVTLPTTSINGATAQELKTPLGTLIRFTRAGVTYTVIGSVPASTAEAAARSL